MGSTDRRKYYSLSGLPIKSRLAVAFACVTIVILCAYSIAVYVVFERYLQRDAMDLVRTQYEAIAADLQFTHSEFAGTGVTEKTLARIRAANNLGLMAYVRDSAGNPVVSPSPISIPTGQEGAFEIPEGGDSLYGYGGSVPGGFTYVLLGKDASVNERLRTLFGILAFVGFVAIVFVFLASYLFSRRALRPIDRLKAHIVSGKVGGWRYDAKDEIGYLAEEFDRYRHRVEDALAREREFSADASHELRTPLTVLGTTLELLEPKVRTSDAKVKIKTMQDAVVEMETLISKLLLVERGLADGEEQEIDVTAFFQDFLPPFENVAEKNGLNLVFETAKAHVFVRSSRERLERVFGNLLRNALQYTKSGSVTVRLGPSGVEIADTGVGIAPVDLGRIWERFYRSEKSRSERGTGLGLSIVKRLANEASWTLSVVSELGRGTTFSVGFPGNPT